MSKYLDERIIMTLSGLSNLKSLHQYKVYYCSSDSEKELIFIGNCWVENSTKTIDITDIVKNDICKRGYGQTFQYAVNCDNSWAYEDVYHIYRYPHKLATYADNVSDMYYTDMDKDNNIKLIAQYPDNNTDKIKPEFYFFYYKYFYMPNVTSGYMYAGNKPCIIHNCVNFSSLNMPVEASVKDVTKDGLTIELKMIMPPICISGLEYDITGNATDYEYNITSFPYYNSFLGAENNGNEDYLVDFYIGDDEDNVRYNIFPQYADEFLQDDIKRRETMNLSIEKVDNSLTDTFFGSTSGGTITGNVFEYTFTGLQPLNYTLYAYDVDDNELFAEDFGSVEDRTKYLFSDSNVDVSTISYLEISANDEQQADYAKININVDKCQANGLSIHFKSWYDGEPHIKLTFEDTYYDVLTLWQHNVVQNYSSIAYMSRSYYTSQGSLAKFSDVGDIIYATDGVTIQNPYLQIQTENIIKTFSINIFGKDGVDIYHNTDSISGNKYYNILELCCNFYIDFLLTYSDGTFGRILLYIHEPIYISRLYVSSNGKTVQFFTRDKKGYDTVNIYVQHPRFTTPISSLTCAKGLFLQWRDRWGSLQCQPFNKVQTYSEEISASEITSYWGKRSIYKTENQPTFKINSGFIDTDLYPVYESIFVSPTLTLYDADTDTAYDVILKDRSYTEKTFVNQQHQMFNLTLELEVSEKQNILY